ncbi:BTB/POZ protein [Xylaria sp. FL0064]|nr:BTB/POZ protein [Xylaria sp. FL0064]
MPNPVFFDSASMSRHRNSAIAGLLDSGAFSDLTLVCKGRQFYVHKNIVCSQSPVINAAINGRFMETRINTIEVDFDLDVLQCTLDYMYKGSYAATPPSPADESQQ